MNNKLFGEFQRIIDIYMSKQRRSRERTNYFEIKRLRDTSLQNILPIEIQVLYVNLAGKFIDNTIHKVLTIEPCLYLRCRQI